MTDIIKEAKSIQDKYTETPSAVTAIEKLRRLDREVTSKAQVVSLCVGIVGTLIAGFGMSLVMVWDMMILGITVGVIGTAIALAAYPLYSKIYSAKKAELAPQIIELSRRITEEGAV